MPQRRTTRLAVRGAVPLMGLLLVTACGSTVQVSGSLTGSGLGDPLVAGGPVPGAPAGGTAPVTGGPVSPGVGGAPAAVTTAPADAPTGPAPGTIVARPAGRGPAAMAPGVTASTVKIGVYTAQGFDKAASAFGFSQIKTGDQAAMAKAVMAYVNAHGGAAGRKMVPVIYDVDVSKDKSSEYQAACSAWTEDERVYALATPVGTIGDALIGCLARKGVIVSASGEIKDERFFQRYADYFYMPGDLNLTQILARNVDALSAAGWFGKSPKIALLRQDTLEEKNAATDGLRPALARHGLRLEDEFATIGQANDYQSAVLRFQSRGITHVMFTSTSPLSFGLAAEPQAYRPKYGMHSRNSPGALLQPTMPSSQLQGSMGMGWQPMNDVDGRRDPGKISDRQQLCLKLIKDAGQDPSVRVTAVIGLWLCDSILFLDDVLDRTSDFAPAGFRAAAETLRHNQAASTFLSSLAPGRTHDGARGFRMFAYATDCSCFRYTTPLRRFPE